MEGSDEHQVAEDKKSIEDPDSPSKAQNMDAFASTAVIDHGTTHIEASKPSEADAIDDTSTKADSTVEANAGEGAQTTNGDTSHVSKTETPEITEEDSPLLSSSNYAPPEEVQQQKSGFNGLAEGLCAGVICFIISQPLYFACGRRYDICLQGSRVLTAAYVLLFTLVGFQAKKVHEERGGSWEAMLAELLKETCGRLKGVTVASAKVAANGVKKRNKVANKDTTAEVIKAKDSEKPKTDKRKPSASKQETAEGEWVEVEDNWLMCCASR